MCKTPENVSIHGMAKLDAKLQELHQRMSAAEARGDRFVDKLQDAEEENRRLDGLIAAQASNICNLQGRVTDLESPTA